MKWVAITGGIASGKSTVAELIAEAGHPVLYADVIAQEQLVPATDPDSVYQKLIAQFGEKILSDSGKMDRRALAKIIFADPEAKDFVESLVHPKVRESVQQQKQQLAAAGHQVAFYEIPLLFEKNLQQEFGQIICVDVSPETQRRRLKQRHLEWSQAEIEARLQSQLPLAEKAKKSDIVIDNNGDLDALTAAVQRLLQDLI